jgi:hypothetical protein
MINLAAYVILALLGALGTQGVFEGLVQWHAVSTLTSKGAEVTRRIPPELQSLADTHEHDSWKRFCRRVLIAFMPKVSGVWIGEDTSLVDADLKLLQSVPHLEFVDLRDPDISGWGLEYLKDIHSFKSLSIHTPSAIGTIGVGDVKCLDRLELLDLHVPIGHNLRGLAEMKHLSFFIAHELHIDRDDLPEAKQLRHLTDLGLFDLKRPDALTKLDFSNWPSLRSLYLSSVQLTSDEWNTIFANTDLVQLSVSDTVLFPAQLSGIGHLENLQVLQFENIRFDPHSEFQLPQIPRLEYVGFRNCAMRDELLSSLVKSPVLRTLVLDGTSLSEDSVERLTFGRRFESLYVDDAIFDSIGKSFRAKNPRVTVLSLSRAYPTIPSHKRRLTRRRSWEMP